MVELKRRSPGCALTHYQVSLKCIFRSKLLALFRPSVNSGLGRHANVSQRKLIIQSVGQHATSCKRNSVGVLFCASRRQNDGQAWVFEAVYQLQRLFAALRRMGYAHATAQRKAWSSEDGFRVYERGLTTWTSPVESSVGDCHPPGGVVFAMFSEGAPDGPHV